MKTWFLNFFRKYRICFLLNILMVVGLFLCMIFADLYVSGSGYIQFNLRDTSFVVGLPVYSLIYGGISYLKTKRIWIPQLLLFSATFPYFLIIEKDIDTLKFILIFSIYPVIFSLVASSITAFFYYIIKSIKENNMKTLLLNFFRKYWFCFLLSIIMVIGIHFYLGDLYLTYVIPLYSFVYGCLSYIISKKAWLPQLILFGVTFINWFIYGIELFYWEGTYIFSAVAVLFSLIGTGITSFIYTIIKSIKKNNVYNDEQ